MMDQGNDRTLHKPRRIERDLVQIVTDHVDMVLCYQPRQNARNEKIEIIPLPGPEYHETIVLTAARLSLIPAAQEHDRMPSLCEPGKHFVEMDFCTAGIRIIPILPVDHKNIHYLTLCFHFFALSILCGSVFRASVF
jgi:hypothetical protein